MVSRSKKRQRRSRTTTRLWTMKRVYRKFQCPRDAQASQRLGLRTRSGRIQNCEQSGLTPGQHALSPPDVKHTDAPWLGK